MKNRSFSLTSHQLWALTQLACILLGFEKTVRDLVMNMTFVNFTEESPCLKGIVHSPNIQVCLCMPVKILSHLGHSSLRCFS